MLLQDHLTQSYPWGGNAYIAGEDVGIVNINGTPAMRPIALFVHLGNHIQMVAHTWSNAQGNYRFSGLNPHYRFLILAVDYEGKYNPVGHSHITPYQPTD